MRLLLCAVLTLTTLAACGPAKDQKNEPAKQDDKPQATITDKYTETCDVSKAKGNDSLSRFKVCVRVNDLKILLNSTIYIQSLPTKTTQDEIDLDLSICRNLGEIGERVNTILYDMLDVDHKYIGDIDLLIQTKVDAASYCTNRSNPEDYRNKKRLSERIDKLDMQLNDVMKKLGLDTLVAK